MRNAASVLGILGGLMMLFVGFFGYGYTELVAEFGEVEGMFEQVENVGLVQTASLGSPLLSIAGGAMARARALWGGILMLISAGLMGITFGAGIFTIFPLGFTALGGLLAILAGKPDEPKAHF
ncbi:MAG: hypothetical protein AAF686_00395 [Pseudomonadota bacterium]